MGLHPCIPMPSSSVNHYAMLGMSILARHPIYHVLCKKKTLKKQEHSK